MKINQYLQFIICPTCKSSKIKLIKKSLFCSHCHTSYQIIDNIPLLINSQEFDDQEKQQMTWFNSHYSKFSNKLYKLENWRLSMINRIFNHKFIKKSKKYLDIGCGATGYTTITAAQKYNQFSFGVDISLEAMIRAQKMAKINKVDDKTAFIVCSAQHLPFKDKTFDYISAVSVLEHLEDDKNAVKEITRILKKHAYFFICVPNTYFKMWFFLWPFYYYNDIKIGHKRHYSINQLEKLLTKKTYILSEYIYNGHLIKFFQLFLDKIKKNTPKLWWQMENKDINQNPSGVQLNTIFQKK